MDETEMIRAMMRDVLSGGLLVLALGYIVAAVLTILYAILD